MSCRPQPKRNLKRKHYPAVIQRWKDEGLSDRTVANRVAAFRTLETTTRITGRALLILLTATVFGRLLVGNQILAIVAAGSLELTDNMYLIWAMIIAYFPEISLWLPGFIGYGN